MVFNNQDRVRAKPHSGNPLPAMLEILEVNDQPTNNLFWRAGDEQLVVD